MKNYCDSLFAYNRRSSKVVTVGSVKIGGTNKIVVQSMTTTDTMDTKASIEQSVKMIDAGCEIVRLTAPSKKDAYNLKDIKKGLKKLGYNTPLVADIHFTPNAAEVAAEIVEKVRVNPGNYADKKKFEEIDYTDESYKEELNRIEKKFLPLVALCKENNVAIRIGTNHGSLSDRIMSKYGDSPLGMVESAMEFLRICEKENFYNIVLSMKASNTLVMVQAYRLLIATMNKEEMNYPLHLGVTEAGDGEDGRIKSAVGIGTLLEDGIGDTIRVSLTEEPELEIPVARKLIAKISNRTNHKIIPPIESSINPFEYKKRESFEIHNIGGKNVPVVFGDLSHLKEIKAANLFALGYSYSVPLDKWNILEQASDYIYIGNKSLNFETPGSLGIVQDIDSWESEKERHYPILSFHKWMKCSSINSSIVFIRIRLEEIINKNNQQLLKSARNIVLVLETDNSHGMAEQRRAFFELISKNIKTAVIIHRKYQNLEEESFQLYSSTDCGALLIDGLGDGIWLEANKVSSSKNICSTSFGILQASRTRISKTEYISCPSCGRTLFDLQETTAKIKKVTSHLKGVKIGIMGCIVNGPGEMADADYGYVGTGVGKITLYKEKEVVERNIPEDDAVNALIDLIKKHNDWVEPTN